MTAIGPDTVTIEEGYLYLTNAGMFRGSSGGVSGNTITLGTNEVCLVASLKGVEHTISKNIKQFAMPVTTGDYTTKTSTSYILDLKRITGALKIECSIYDDYRILRPKAGLPADGFSVYQKKAMLQHLVGEKSLNDIDSSYPESYYGGVFRVIWGKYSTTPQINTLQHYYANIEKMTVYEVSKWKSGTFMVDSGPPPVHISGRLRKMDVTILLKIGINR